LTIDEIVAPSSSHKSKIIAEIKSLKETIDCERKLEQDEVRVRWLNELNDQYNMKL